MGGVVPVLSLYLKELPGFTGSKTGFVLSMASIASVTSPLIAQRIADRYISAEKLFSILHLLCGVLLIVFRQQSSFITVTLLYLFLMISLSPTSPLLNVLVFHSLGKEKKKYGFLRVWGTVGWIFMAVFFSYIWLGSDLISFKR
jgi:predicted MFS family arabinose efflux permease